jgi:hypothetical protein
MAARRRSPLPPTRAPRRVARRPLPNRPADGGSRTIVRRQRPETGTDQPGNPALFDPFKVYAEGELQLRRRLTVLPSTHLVSIAVTHGMTSLTRASLECLPAATLVEVIVLAVTRGSSGGPRRR